MGDAVLYATKQDNEPTSKENVELGHPSSRYTNSAGPRMAAGARKCGDLQSPRQGYYYISTYAMSTHGNRRLFLLRLVAQSAPGKGGTSPLAQPRHLSSRRMIRNNAPKRWAFGEGYSIHISAIQTVPETTRIVIVCCPRLSATSHPLRVSVNGVHGPPSSEYSTGPLTAPLIQFAPIERNTPE